MSSPITFGGISSGLPVEDIITQLMAVERRPLDLLQQKKANLNLQNAQYGNLKTRVSDLYTTLNSLTAQSVLDKNLFQLKSATSSDSAVATATASSTAAAQSFQLEVVQLATATKATSQSGVGQLITGASPITDVAQGTMTTGTFTIFVNGVSNQVTVSAGETVDDVLANIDAIAGINSASVVGGQIQLSFTGGTVVKLGASADTSNFLNVTQLKTGTATATDITSANPLIAIQLNQDVSTAAANLQTAVTGGSTFTIGTATFDTTGKTLSQIISDINNDPDSGVTASFNVVTNKLELISKDTGSGLITLADTSGNFLTAMGLIVGGDTTASQTAGINAHFKLNGIDLYNASNTVTEGITGLTGVTLELKNQAPGSPITIDVARDTSELKTKIQELVANFNKVISFIDEQTNSQSSTAQLKREGGVKRLRNSLRTQITDSVAGLTTYNSLQAIGISTGAVTGTLATPTNQIQLSETLLDAALADNPSEVEQLAIGTNGILTKLQALVDAALEDEPDPTQDGLFAAHDTSLSNQIKSIDDAIERGQARLELKEKMLRQQFAAMEQLITQFQSQGNAITALNQQLTANSG